MRSVLVVDDDEKYLAALRRALASAWSVLTASSVEEARQRVNERRPDVALLDIRLSEDEPDNREGLTLLAWLRAEHPSVPVVLMSGYRDFDAAVEAVNIGAARFLKKPIDLRELNATLRSLCQPENKDR